MSEQTTMIPPPEKTVATIQVRDIMGAETAIPSASLIESMMKTGQLTPIIVEFNQKYADDPQPYTVVAGRRRVAAARHLGWEEIDAVIYEVGDINPDLVGLIENSMRSSNPMSELLMIHHLEREGLTDQEIAKRTGMSPGTILKRRRLGNLSLESANAVESGRMAVGVAEGMAKLPRNLQEAVLRDHPSGRITGNHVREAREVQRQAEWSGMSFAEMVPTPAAPSWKAVAINHLEAAISVIPIDGADLALLIARIKDVIEEGSDAIRGSA